MFRRPDSNLSADEATEFTERLIESSGANMPLVPGLRAAADEIANVRVQAGLNQLAECIEKGQPLEHGLETSKVKIPAYLAGLLDSGVRSGHLADVLAELTHHYRSSRDQWRQVWLALAYPCSLLICLAFVAGFVLYWVVPQIGEIFGDFDTELPAVTSSLIWTSTTGWKYAIAVLPLLVGLAIVGRVLGGVGSWTRVLSTLPGIGALIQWHGYLEFSYLLRMLLIQEVPLPEALNLTAGAVRNANVSNTTRHLAQDVAGGTTLADAMFRNDQVPTHIIPFVRLGEEHGDLPESLNVISDLMEGQIRLRSQLLIVVLPPIIFLIVAGTGIALVVSLFLPLLNLISNLI